MPSRPSLNSTMTCLSGDGGLLGTDSIGRSNLARILFGARTSLLIAVGATAVGALLGLLLGAFAGYYRKAIDAGSTIITNTIASVPAILLMLALITAIGPSVIGLILALGVVLSEMFVRVVRGAVIATAERDYVLAARALGASDFRVLTREVLPNILPVLLSVVPLAMAIAILVESSLSFLGYGVPPPFPSWGGMISEAASIMRGSPWAMITPVTVLFLTIFSLNTIGDRLSRYGDKRDVHGL
jgi:peptide/nickel transport system permease protein